jgi:hypothetical protein
MQKEVLLAVYKENCDQTRQHEAYRDKVCGLAMTAVGVLLGLLGFGADAWAAPTIAHLAIPAFIIGLGCWARITTAKHDERAAMHRQRIRGIRVALSNLIGIDLAAIGTAADTKHKEDYFDKCIIDKRTYDLWKSFSLLIIFLGVFLGAYIVARLLHLL